MDPGAKRVFMGPKGPLGPERSDFFTGPKGPLGPLGPERKDFFKGPIGSLGPLGPGAKRLTPPLQRTMDDQYRIPVTGDIGIPVPLGSDGNVY